MCLQDLEQGLGELAEGRESKPTASVLVSSRPMERSDEPYDTSWPFELMSKTVTGFDETSRLVASSHAMPLTFDGFSSSFLSCDGSCWSETEAAYLATNALRALPLPLRDGELVELSTAKMLGHEGISGEKLESGLVPRQRSNPPSSSEDEREVVDRWQGDRLEKAELGLLVRVKVEDVDGLAGGHGELVGQKGLLSVTHP